MNRSTSVMRTMDDIQEDYPDLLNQEEEPPMVIPRMWMEPLLGRRFWFVCLLGTRPGTNVKRVPTLTNPSECTTCNKSVWWIHEPIWNRYRF
jgi:hypothetical protein